MVAVKGTIGPRASRGDQGTLMSVPEFVIGWRILNGTFSCCGMELDPVVQLWRFDRVNLNMMRIIAGGHE